jgi:hypothetical protein
MTTEEQRKQSRERQQRHREKKRQAAYIPSADEAFDQFPEEQTQVLREHVRDVLQQVKSELGLEGFGNYQDNQNAEYAIDAVACTLFALKKNWVREVRSPNGVMVGGTYFPDALGSVIVEAAHRYGLEKSQTFATLYRELLQMLDKRYGKEPTEHARDIKAELAGSYVLLSETKPEPKPEVPEVQPEPLFNRPSGMPSPEEVQEAARDRLLGSGVAADAWRYLTNGQMNRR